MEKNEKPFEIGLEEVIQKELQYLCGNAICLDKHLLT